MGSLVPRLPVSLACFYDFCDRRLRRWCRFPAPESVPFSGPRIGVAFRPQNRCRFPAPESVPLSGTSLAPAAPEWGPHSGTQIGAAFRPHFQSDVAPLCSASPPRGYPRALCSRHAVRPSDSATAKPTAGTCSQRGNVAGGPASEQNAGIYCKSVICCITYSVAPSAM